jgi:DNA-directed RNA polymerase specialized sigma24 family protein
MDENSIVEGLRQKDNSSFGVLYRYYFSSIEKLVRDNSGNTDDAKDVFQETMIVLLEKIPSHKFILTASVKTYVYAVASNIWLKKLRDTKKTVALTEEPGLEDLSFSKWEWQEEERLSRNRIARIFSKVTRHCMILLTKTFLNGTSREQLMLEMGYKNSHTFNNQRYKCLEQARKK